MFKIVDCKFNRVNYPNLVNLYCNEPPAYARVIKIQPYRRHECWKCKNSWVAKVEKGEGNTQNISGEVNQYCPKCNQRSSCASAWIDENGADWDFESY